MWRNGARARGKAQLLPHTAWRGIMLRDVPTLQSLVLKQIAATPARCLHDVGCQRMLEALEQRGWLAEQDMVQRIVQHVIDAGRMTDEALPSYLLRNRTSISLSNSKVSGRYLIKVASLSGAKLVRLDVSGCFQVTTEVLREVLQLCPRLTHLNLRACRKLTNSFPTLLAQNAAPCLTSLQLGGAYNIDDEGVRTLLGCPIAKNLRDLDLSGLQVSDATLLMLSEKCPSLVSMGLAYLDVREGTYGALFQRLGSQLEAVNLSWPSTVTPARNEQLSADFLIHVVAAACPRLAVLDVSGNKNVTADVLRDLLERKLAAVQDAGSMVESRMLEALTAKFVGSPKASIESNVMAYYHPAVRIVC